MPGVATSAEQLQELKRRSKERELLPLIVHFFKPAPFNGVITSWIPDADYYCMKGFFNAVAAPLNNLGYLAAAVSFDPSYSVFAQDISFKTNCFDFVGNCSGNPVNAMADLGQDGYFLEQGRPVYFLVGIVAPTGINVLGTITLGLKPMFIR